MSYKITDRALKRSPNGHGYQGTCDHVGRYRRPRTSLTKGVTRQVKLDGHGNKNTFWVASIMAQGVVRSTQFSVRKYGEAEAKRLARACRQRWLIELKVWEPKAGDLLAFAASASFVSGRMSAAEVDRRWANLQEAVA